MNSERRPISAKTRPTLPLIAVAQLSEYGEIRTRITKLTSQVITYIEQRHGRRLTEEPFAKLLGLAAWRSPQFSW